MSRKRKNKDQDGLYQRQDSPYWWASYTDTSGKRTRRSTGAANRKEAEALLAKWRVETHRASHWGDEPSRTFDELMLQYLAETRDAKRASDRDLVSLKRLYPVFSGRAVEVLENKDVRRYIAQRRNDGAAAGTINREVGLMSSAINYAIREWGWRLMNPAAGCKLREAEGRVRWITQVEALALIEASAYDYRAQHLPDFIQLALHTGCRRGEMLGLEWRRVNFDERLILLEADHTKTARRRTVPINADALEALNSRKAFRSEHCPASPWVFAHKDGSRIGSVKTSFRTACKRAGIDDFRVHDLRHTCAAWLVTAGVPMAEVRDLLGHSTIAMTERYAHLAPENIRAAVRQLEGLASRFGHVGNKGKE